MSDEDARAFALKCDTTLGHLRNVMYGTRPCSPELAVALEVNSDKKVRRWDVRPEDWHRIWPELIGLSGAPAAPESEAA